MSMTISALRAAAVASLVAATSASAVDRPVSDPGFVRKALDEATRCILDDKPGLVRTFLQTPVDAKEATRLAAVMNKSGCMQTASRAMDLEFAPALLRGAFYKQMYVRAYANRQPAATGTPVDFRAQVTRTTPEMGVMRQYAACVVQGDPATARRLVLADTESRDEAEAYVKLSPAGGLCSIQGSAANASKAMLTGLIAEALYVSAAGPAGEGTNA